MFPSWSYLGWIGQAAYPWIIGRSLAFSTLHSPHYWVDPKKNESFRSESIRTRPYSTADMEEKWLKLEGRWGYIERHNPFATPIFQPIEFIDPRPFSYIDRSKTIGKSHLRFTTWSAEFVLVRDVREHRESYNMVHILYYVQLLDVSGYGVGYIDAPGPEFLDTDFGAMLGTKQEFVVLSRASLDPWTKNLPDPLPTLDLVPDAEAGRSDEAVQEDGTGVLEETARFDTLVYDQMKPWCLFNVMVIKRLANGVAVRMAIGRIHIDAFIRARPAVKTIVLA
jgi:hypothetical protein